MDTTVLERQHKRLSRLKAQGITRSTVLVHDDCRPALDSLRPHLVDPSKAAALAVFEAQIQGRRQPVNVAQVRQLSPFRYPGGKTWLVPEVRAWVRAMPQRPRILIEPFAGGAMVGLSAAAENWVDQVELVELDADVAAVWRLIFHGSDADVALWTQRITGFHVAEAEVRAVLEQTPTTRAEMAFRTLIKNRMQRGGIMAAGAGLIKSGENGRGLASRWYPETLVKRINFLRQLVGKLTFFQEDALVAIARHQHDEQALFFVDPPYTAGGKRAGSRLYTHNQVDHDRLFTVMAEVRGAVMMTYDDSPEVRALAARHGFRVDEVPMKNTHHAIIRELLILKP